MTEHTEVGGSAPRWGQLFGARATDWAQTWEGHDGWGTSVYGHVLDRARIGVGTRVLDCGCGAGRFARMAADRGVDVAGIDAALALVEIAAGRTPRAFTAAGLTQLAIAQSGEPAVAQAVRDALHQFTGPNRHVILPGWFRIVTAR